MCNSVEVSGLITTACYVSCTHSGRCGALSLLTIIKRGQGTATTSIHRYSLSFDSSHVCLHFLVLCEIPLELIFIEIRLETEYFLGNLLIFTLNPLQLGLALVEVKTLCFEFDCSD